MLKRFLTAGIAGIISIAASGPEQPIAIASRVVLFSIDAGGDSLLDQLLASGALKGGAFERIAAHGLVAESMTPPAVSSTPVSHATMFTGAWPERHGITGVTLPGDDIGGNLRSGFAIETSVDRLWTILQRAGKRVVCVTAPGADGTRPDNTCSDTLAFMAIASAPPPDDAVGGGEFESRVRQMLGPSPAEPDARIPTRGEIPEEAYVAGAERFAEYQSRIVLKELERKDWDLLIVYMPIVDNLAHRYLLTDRRQREYGEEAGARRERFTRFIEHGFKKVDAIISTWMQSAPETTFVIVSDHGMVPTHSAVLLNNVLASAGLRVEGDSAQVRALTSGGSGQVYVNSRPRFPRGVVTPGEVQRISDGVVRAVRSVRDPATGSAVFSVVTARSDFGRLGLQHPNAGDIFVSTMPGWSITGRFGADAPAIVSNTLSPDVRQKISRTSAEERFLASGGLNELSLGIHGHRPGDPRLQATFMATGPGVPRRRVGVVQMVDVTPTVLRLLGVAAPASVTGRPIW